MPSSIFWIKMSLSTKSSMENSRGKSEMLSIIFSFVSMSMLLLVRIAKILSAHKTIKIGGICCLFLLQSLAQPTPTLSRFVFRRGLFGTQFVSILYAPDSTVAKRAYNAVSARMDSLNQIMSDYLDGSEINNLSKTAGQNRFVPVSATLFDVLTKAKTIAQTSGGRFDFTIGPLSQLWRRAVRRGEFPTAKQRRTARKSVGYQLVELDSATKSVRLRRPGMKLDLGGIGQGYALDVAQTVLHQHNVYTFLLDLGGDVLAGNPPPNQAQGWRILVGSPTNEKQAQFTNPADTLTVFLKNAAVTTSGDTYRFLEHNGKRYSHVMNPCSGLGLRHFVRATVLAPTGTYADALTKVFSVAGIGKSRRLLKRFPGAALYLLENRNGMMRSWPRGDAYLRLRYP
jgi:FAD:protein FMN transferase